MQPRSSCVSIHRFGLSPLTSLKKQKTKTVQRRTSPSPPRFLAPFALLSLDRGARRCGARSCRRLRAGILYLFLSSSCAAHGYRDHPRRRLREPICDGEPAITTTLGAREDPGQRRRLPSAHIFISAAIRFELWTTPRCHEGSKNGGQRSRPGAPVSSVYFLILLCLFDSLKLTWFPIVGFGL